MIKPVHIIAISLVIAMAISPASPQTSAVDARSGSSALEEVRHLVRAGQLAEAESAARSLLGREENEYGDDSLQAAQVMHVLAEALWRRGRLDDPETLRFAERSLAIEEMVLGPDDPEVARTLNLLGNILDDLGESERAWLLYERALAINEEVFGPDHPFVAVNLNNLAQVVGGEEAVPLLERALAIYERAYGPDHREVAGTLVTLANTLANMGQDLQQTRALLERALAIEEQQLGAEHPELADTLSSLGYCLWELAEYREAKSLLVRSLRIRENHGDLLGASYSLLNLAIVVGTLGEGLEAIELLERAVEIREQIYGPDDPEVAIPLVNLGMFLVGAGDYSGARQAYERGLAIFEHSLGPEAGRTLWTLDAIGSLLAQIGDHEAARRYWERASSGPADAYPGGGPGTLAQSFESTGEYDRAKALYEQALSDMVEAGYSLDHPDAADYFESLARVLQQLGQYEEAERLYQRALRIKEQVFGPDHPDVAATWAGLADLRVDLGVYDEARRLYEETVRVQTAAFGAAHPIVGITLHELAKVLLLEGDLAAAFETALRAEEITRRHLRLTARSLVEREALRYGAVRASGLDVAFSVTTGAPGSSRSRAAFAALVQSRAVVTDEVAERHRTAAGASDPELRALVEQLESARRRLANLTVRGLRGGLPQGYRRLVDGAREEKEVAERALAERSRYYRSELARRALSLADVQASLPRGSALVAFARYRQFPVFDRRGSLESLEPREAVVPRQEPVPSYLAFVLREETVSPTLVPLGSAAEVEALLSHWGQEAARGTRARGWTPEEAEAAYRAAGYALRQKIWDPIVPHLAKARLVFVVPDGALHRLALAALPAGDEKYLIEQAPLIHYLSTERDLVPSAAPSTTGEGLLALGAPAYDAAPTAETDRDRPARLATLSLFRGERSGCGDFESLQFQPLPGTSRELKDIVAQWSRRSKRLGIAEQLTGREASEEAFKMMASGRQVLHVATHGFFLEGWCPSALETAQALRSVEPTGPSPVVGENPLLLSGLALAGANRRDQAEGEVEDGILTAEEVAALDLSGTEWAVLSACDTGLGKVRPGEGVFGLRRAFQIAGVRTLIVSQWRVDDESARQWMRALYRYRFRKGLTTAEAVREAGLDVLNRRRSKGQSTHPFYWAGFVATGDWR